MNPKRTFTLVELLVSIALCSTLLLFGNAFIEGVRGVEMVRDFEYGISLARQAIETLKAKPWEHLEEIVRDDFDKVNQGIDYFQVENWSGGAPGKGTRYERRVFVEKVSAHSGQDHYPTYLKLVTVDVTWKNAAGKELKYSVSTLISRVE